MMVNFLLGIGALAAVEDEVYTKRFTDGVAAAEVRIDLMPAMTSGMTLYGSGSNVRLEATWQTPEHPTMILVYAWYHRPLDNRISLQC